MLSRVLLLVVSVAWLGAPQRSLLSYRESSVGLTTPQMEGGRTEIEFGDVNADGHPDIVSIGDHGSPRINSGQQGIMVWFGDGLGNWAHYQTGNFGYGGVALGDVNGDGLIDAGYSMHHNYSSNDFGNQLIEVALGDGTGRVWTPHDDGLATSGEDYGMFGTDFADVDNDGDLDLGSVSFGCCSGIHIYLNNGNGTWTQSFGWLGGNSMMDIQFADINADGNADFACGLGNAPGGVYFGDGHGNFTVADGNLPPAGNRGRSGISLGDVTGDGKPEIAFTTGTGTGGIAVWQWVSGTNWQKISNGLPTSGSFEATQIADMNLDGFGDVVAFGSGQCVVYLGDGQGNWQLATSFSTPGVWGYSAFRAGVDLDHNGYPDIGIVASEGSQFSNRNRPRVFVENSIPSEPSIFDKFPRGGEIFRAGAVQFVEWHSAVPASPSASSVTIELSTSSSNGPWRAVAEDIPNNGRYQWRIPKNLKHSDRCHLRLTLETTNGSALITTPRPFTILGPSPTIQPNPIRR